jgi:hypothetical protein
MTTAEAAVRAIAMLALPKPLAWMPLERAVLCLECESVYEIGPPCPRCAGGEFLSLSSVLNRGVGA